jgi:nucleoside-diphosphate-sugar epimerase
MISKCRYLVTGGTGFIGSALVHRLLALGAHVRVLDDDSRGSPRRLAEVLDRVEIIRGDVRDAQVVRAAARGVDVLCHLAFVNGTQFFYEKPELVLDVGVKGMVNVLDACAEHGIRRFILASSSEVYQTPPVIPTPEMVPLVVPDATNPRYSYGAGKLISEVMAINYGRRLFESLYIFRPHNVFGPDMGWEHVIPQFALRMAKAARQATGTLPFPIQGSGDETRAFIFIDDFVEAWVTMLSGPAGIYNIGSEEERTVRSVAEAVAQVFGRTVEVQAGGLTQGSTPRRCPDVSKLRALGFAPRTPFLQGLTRTVRWYAEHASLAPLRNQGEDGSSHEQS